MPKTNCLTNSLTLQQRVAIRMAFQVRRQQLLNDWRGIFEIRGMLPDAGEILEQFA